MEENSAGYCRTPGCELSWRPQVARLPFRAGLDGRRPGLRPVRGALRRPPLRDDGAPRLKGTRWDAGWCAWFKWPTGGTGFNTSGEQL